MIKLLLDTDIGSDIDDAMCLAYLLSQSDCELMGITTVSGEPEKRAMIASALCRVAGKQVPIFPGAANPLLVPQRQEKAPQAAALSRLAHNKKFPRGQAVEFMRRTIRRHPGEIVLLTIGPLTNAALLFCVDPEIPSLLKSLVIMGGAFTYDHPRLFPAEWNAFLDPHAAAIVYRANVANHRSVGLDVTCQLVMDAQQVREKFCTELLRTVLDFAEVYFQNNDRVIFHDPLAAVTIFDSQVCTFERGHVEVETEGERVMGMTHWMPDVLGKQEIAVQVDAARFFESYFSVFR